MALIASPRPGSSPPLCLPLLKFDSDSPDSAHLDTQGLDALASLPAPVSVVALLGDSRCGKSTLASRLIDDERLIFPVGHTDCAVTEGIDMCIVPRRGESEGSLVVLDCEGCNNPTGSVHGAMDLIAMFISTLTVQVVWGHMSESQLWQIGQGIAMCDRLLSNESPGNSPIPRKPSFSSSSPGSSDATPQRAAVHAANTADHAGQTLHLLPSRRLLMVVNGCHLQFEPDQLHKTFNEIHKGSASSRNELRASIRQKFEQIEFATIPLVHDSSYLDRLEAFRSAVDKDCTPADLSGIRLTGEQIADMLRFLVSKLRTSGAVPVPSVFRHMIFDHLLKPLVDRLVEKFKASLPDVSDGEYRILIPDARSDILTEFDHDIENLTLVELVDEAREDLNDRIDEAWMWILEQNDAVGKQDRHVSAETEVRYAHHRDRVVSVEPRIRCCCFRPSIAVEQQQVCKQFTRTWVLKKNGQIAHTDWIPVGADRIEHGDSSLRYSTSTMSLRQASEEDTERALLGSEYFDLEASGERPLGLAGVLRVMAETDLSFDDARHQLVLSKMAQFGIDESGVPADSKLVTFDSMPRAPRNSAPAALHHPNFPECKLGDGCFEAKRDSSERSTDSHRQKPSSM